MDYSDETGLHFTFLFLFIYFLLWYQGVKSGPPTCYAGTLPLLTHPLSLLQFCFCYFLERVLWFCPTRASLRWQSLYPCLLLYLELPIWTTIPGLLVEKGVSLFARAGSNWELLNLYFPSSWNYRHELLCSIHIFTLFFYVVCIEQIHLMQI
jgi:hypothetical protein